jgi:multidrug efflux pump subunit AcrA (membrane-fusion protein)
VGTEETTGQEPVNESEGQEPKDEGTRQETFDAAYVKQLRDEAASWRRKVKDLEGKIAGFEQEKMTEAERAKALAEAAQAEAKAAQEALRKARADAAISKVAAKHGVDADLLGKLVSVEFDDDGQPTGVDAAISDLLTKHPYLKAGSAVSLSATNPQRKGALTIEDVKRMSEKEINARWNEIKPVLEASRQ